MWRKGWESVRSECGEVWERELGCGGSSLKRGVGSVLRRGGRWGSKKMWGRCRKVCWGVGGRYGKWGERENMGEVWESVLGAKESEKKCVGVWGR